MGYLRSAPAARSSCEERRPALPGPHHDVESGVAAAATAVAAQALWLIIYLRISAPINRTLTAAAKAGRVPSDARSLQHRWDGVITARAILQAAAAASLCAALAIP